MADDDKRRLAIILFEGFELLDVFGPLELFGALPDRFTMALVGPGTDPVQSAQGPRVLADHVYKNAPLPRQVGRSDAYRPDTDVRNHACQLTDVLGVGGEDDASASGG